MWSRGCHLLFVLVRNSVIFKKKISVHKKSQFCSHKFLHIKRIKEYLHYTYRHRIQYIADHADVTLTLRIKHICTPKARNKI